ncbi:MAG: 23S rRNA (guanosine(2251)-2'-O)-methyltransferase RlmB [Saprospiraceae bacterium]|nr:23S rRNA (guanosine(2251)-2'-O)-methyltransferase RlmB [Saprospiraceae bacterium]
MASSAIIYGRKPVLEYLQDGNQAERIFVQRGVDRSFVQDVKALAHPLGIPVHLVPKPKMSRLTRKNHQGVVAFVPVVEYQDLSAVVQLAFERGESPLLVMLDGITDVRNVGAIARSAEAFGCTAMVLPMRGGALITEDAVKTSAGAIRRLTLCRVPDMAGSCMQLRDMGLRVCVSDQQGQTPLPAIDLTGPVAVVMGSEDAGVHKTVTAVADQVFVIPQFGQTESLNVSVASGIILYEAIRQRKTL